MSAMAARFMSLCMHCEVQNLNAACPLGNLLQGHGHML